MSHETTKVYLTRHCFSVLRRGEEENGYYANQENTEVFMFFYTMLLLYLLTYYRGTETYSFVR
jgi:hypothetical protein